MNGSPQPRIRIGRSWFGGGSRLLTALSLTVGAILSAGTAGLVLAAQDPSRPMTAFTVTALGTLPLFAALGWLLLVDTRSIRTPSDLSEQSIEVGWSVQAGFHAFVALIVLTLGAAFVFTLAELRPPLNVAMVCLAASGVVVYGLHYVRLARADG